MNQKKHNPTKTKHQLSQLNDDLLKSSAAEPLQADGFQPLATMDGGNASPKPTITDNIPRLVIRGERYLLNNPDSGESHHLQAIGSNGKAKIITTTLPKEDTEPQAALTDYLNTTFQFSSSQEKIIELVGYFKLFLGEVELPPFPFGN